MLKVEFGSEAWIDYARRYLEENVGALGDSAKGVRYAVCEVFTGAPEAVALPGTDRFAWYLVVDDGRVEVGRGERDDVDRKAMVDYAVALPIVRTVFAENPEVLAAIRKAQKAAAKASSSDSAPSAEVPDALAPVFADMHDHLARVTA